MNARIFVTALVALLLSTAGSVSAENEARVYVVLSLVGDQISVVNYQPSTAGHLDQNLHQSIAVADRIFDKTALLAADEAFKHYDAGARVKLLVTSTPDLFTKQDRFFDSGRIALPKEIDSAVRTDGATHLVLITKYRAAANLQARQEKWGSGNLEGLGFYVDGQKETKRIDTGEVGRGYLAPFVYIKVSLVDLNTSMVVREQRITASTTLSAARAKEGSDPWDVLNPVEKVEKLQGMISKELAGALPQIIARP